jgi:hypothetical protein
MDQGPCFKHCAYSTIALNLMGDWCGSTQVEPRTDQKEITGADWNENDVVLL